MGGTSAVSIDEAASQSEQVHLQLLPGDRILIGTVVEVRSGQAGEELPRFVPIEVREAKGLPDLKIGDGVEITVNDQNLLVDVHLIGEGGTIASLKATSFNRW
jgi:hypothetical protein